MIAACAVGAGAWPASAGPAGAVSRAKPPATQPGSALLITGDHVSAGSAPALTGTTEAGRGGSLIGLDVAGTQYLIPSDAVPYLGHGLDMNLFDVHALPGLEQAGALRVRVTYSGRVPRLPGVKITGASDGVASGYLTPASAPAFGTALARLFASDRTRGHYGRDGMFAGGLRISLAGATPAAAPAPARSRSTPTYTLTVDGIDRAGQPDNGDHVVVANVDDPKLFGDSFHALGTFANGTATFQVPAGTYWATGVFSAGVAWGGPRHATTADDTSSMVVLPQFTVSANTTVTVDARTAASKVRISTPLPSVQQSEQVNAERIAQDGQKFTVSVNDGSQSTGFYVTTVSQRPADGTLDSVTGAQLFSPLSAAEPYQYYIDVRSPGGTIPPQSFRISASSLATVHENLFAGAASTGSFLATSVLPGELGQPLNVFSRPMLSVPCADTVYLSTVGGSAAWQSYYTQIFPAFGGQDDSPVTYWPGQVTTVDWNAYPLHTAPNVNLPGAIAGKLIVSANRSGNKLTLAFMPFSDSAPGHLGTGYSGAPGSTVSGRYVIKEGGTTIASGNALKAQGVPSGEFYDQVTLSPEKSVITFTLTAKRTGAAFTLSPATRTTWIWPSSHESGATVPDWWYCSLASNHNCAAQPLPMLSYAVGGLALNGTTKPGAQSLTVTVGSLQLAQARKVTKVTVQASFDGGTTWTSAVVTGQGIRYHAGFTAPAASDVTLRVVAVNAAGAAESETITNAYATGS